MILLMAGTEDGRFLGGELHAAGAKEAEVIKVSARTGWEAEIDYFLGCIEAGQAPALMTPAEARESVALCHVELESIKKRKPVAF